MARHCEFNSPLPFLVKIMPSLRGPTHPYGFFVDDMHCSSIQVAVFDCSIFFCNAQKTLVMRAALTLMYAGLQSIDDSFGL